MIWLAAQWHRIIIALIGLERLWERTKPLWRKMEWFERREHRMNIVDIEKDFELVKSCWPEFVAAATAIKAFYDKIEAIKTAQAQAAGAPPAGQV